MSTIKSCLYFIEFKDGTEETMNQVMLESAIDNIFDNVIKIVKRYRLQDNLNKTYYMTLFTADHCISTSDYIEHYRDLSKEKYGAHVLDDFDVEIITLFN